MKLIWMMAFLVCMKQTRNAILFWIALVLAVIFIPLGGIYGVARNIIIHGWVGAFELFSIKNKMLAISIDKLGNVAGGELWNDIFTKKKSIRYPFGHHDDTMSECFGRNKSKTDSDFGKWFSGFLNWLDPGHVEDAINDDDDGYLAK